MLREQQVAAEIGDLLRLLLAPIADGKATPLGIFRAGVAQFAVYGDDPLVVPWAKVQFAKADAGQVDAHIRLSYEGLPDHPGSTWLARLNYTNVRDILTYLGLSGFYHAEHGQLEVFDPARRLGLRVLPSKSAVRVWEETAPLTNFVSWTNALHDAHILHAASLCAGGRGALICGAGGTGKSSLTLAGIHLGMDSAGDDYVVIDRTESGWRAWQCCAQAKQTPDGLDRLGPAGAGKKVGPLNWQGKQVFNLPSREWKTPLPIDCVIVPFRAETSAFSPIASKIAFRTLTESTFAQLYSDRSTAGSFAADLVRGLPCFRFDMGPDILANAAALRDMLMVLPR